MTKELLVGTWQLLEVTFEYTDGQTGRLYGEAEGATGMIVYDAAGHVSAQIMRPDRPQLPSRGSVDATAEQLRGVFDGYVAYFGRYEVQPDGSTVIHRPFGALRPGNVGSEIIRRFVVTPDRLTLTTTPTTVDGRERVSHVAWQRVG